MGEPCSEIVPVPAGRLSYNVCVLGLGEGLLDGPERVGGPLVGSEG